jgi:hypothetical protein
MLPTNSPGCQAMRSLVWENSIFESLPIDQAASQRSRCGRTLPRWVAHIQPGGVTGASRLERHSAQSALGDGRTSPDHEPASADRAQPAAASRCPRAPRLPDPTAPGADPRPPGPDPASASSRRGSESPEPVPATPPPLSLQEFVDLRQDRIKVHHRPSTCASATSAWGSQKVMSIAR